MKKILAFAVILALLVPAAAFAAAEFTLGGFVKLDTFWDSTQQTKNMNIVLQRDNHTTFNHGRLKWTAQGSRFNLTIKGPKVFGAQTNGFIEMDFDDEGDALQTASNAYVPRLRHAMFRFNWPTTELLLGQYWSMFCEWYPEMVEDGPMQVTGAPTARMAQVRVTQKFAGAWTVAGLIGQPNNTVGGQAFFTSANSGENAEAPQIQAKLEFAQDLWGKAAFYGRPTPFTAKVTAGWQRNVFASSTNFAGLRTWAENAYSPNLATVQLNQQYLNPWMIMGTIFAPIIPTQSANLAGTASITTQWWIGQGVDAFGVSGFSNSPLYRASSLRFIGNQLVYNYTRELQKRYGGYVQAQYYFNNQWFMNLAYGMSKAFGASQSDRAGAAFNAVNNPNAYAYAVTADIAKFYQQFAATLWYRPVTAIKFGLQYSWGQTTWFQTTSGGATYGAAPFSNAVAGVPVFDVSNTGNASRVEFVGFFYF
ncbi:MAG: hypothetical protein ACOZFS_03285 [Thermodesulfobacteriota bacterium]